MKKILILFCVLYTVVNMSSNFIKTAWALEGWQLEDMLKEIIESKIDARDFDFKRQVQKVVERDCHIEDVNAGTIVCR